MPNHCEHTLSVNDPLSCYSGCSAGWRVIRRVRAEVRAPVISAITNGSPSNQPPPSSTSPALQSKGTVSTHVKSRMEQEGHSGRKKEGGGRSGRPFAYACDPNIYRLPTSEVGVQPCCRGNWAVLPITSSLKSCGNRNRSTNCPHRTVAMSVCDLAK